MVSPSFPSLQVLARTVTALLTGSSLGCRYCSICAAETLVFPASSVQTNSRVSLPRLSVDDSTETYRLGIPVRSRIGTPLVYSRLPVLGSLPSRVYKMMAASSEASICSTKGSV